MWGIWCGTGFQPVSEPVSTGRMPAPGRGYHQFPHMSHHFDLNITPND
jgi:hypothetical protein